MTSSDMTLVYSGSPTLETATGWEKLIFNQNGGVFEYNGTDNLVVVVCKSASSWTGGLKYYYTSVDNSTLGRHDDDESVCADVSSATYSYSTSDYRPSVKFWVEYPFYYISVNGNVCYGTTISVLDGMLFL